MKNYESYSKQMRLPHQVLKDIKASRGWGYHQYSKLHFTAPTRILSNKEVNIISQYPSTSISRISHVLYGEKMLCYIYVISKDF